MNATLRIALTWFGFLSLQRVLNVIGGGLLVLSLLSGISNELGAHIPGAPFGVLGAVLILITPMFGAGAALRTYSSRNAAQLLPRGRARMLCGATLAITLMAVVATLPVLFAHLGDSAGNPIAQANPAEVFATAWTCAALICIASFIASASTQTMLLVILVPTVVSQIILAIKLPSQVLGDETDASGGLAVLSVVFAVAAWLVFCAWYLRVRSIRATVHLMPGSQWLSRVRANSTAPLPAAQAPITRAAAIRQYLLGTQSLRSYCFWGAVVTLLMMLVLWLFVRKAESFVLLISMMVVGYVALNISFVSGYGVVQRTRRLWLRAGMRREELFRIAERMGVINTLSFVGVVATGIAIWSLSQRFDLAANILMGVPLQLLLAACLFYAFLGHTGKWSLLTVVLDIAVGAWLLVVIALPRPFQNLPQTSLVLLTLTVALTWLLRTHARRRWRTVHWRPVPKFDRRVT